MLPLHLAGVSSDEQEEAALRLLIKLDLEKELAINRLNLAEENNKELQLQEAS